MNNTNGHPIELALHKMEVTMCYGCDDAALMCHTSMDFSAYFGVVLHKYLQFYLLSCDHSTSFQYREFGHLSLDLSGRFMVY
jgi:hypothetical protein